MVSVSMLSLFIGLLGAGVVVFGSLRFQHEEARIVVERQQRELDRVRAEFDRIGDRADVLIAEADALGARIAATKVLPTVDLSAEELPPASVLPPVQKASYPRKARIAESEASKAVERTRANQGVPKDMWYTSPVETRIDPADVPDDYFMASRRARLAETLIHPGWAEGWERFLRAVGRRV